MNLTSAQMETLNYLVAFSFVNNGRLPGTTEIMERFGLSKTAALGRVGGLKSKGIIDFTGNGTNYFTTAGMAYIEGTYGMRWRVVHLTEALNAKPKALYQMLREIADCKAEDTMYKSVVGAMLHTLEEAALEYMAHEEELWQLYDDQDLS